MPTPIPARSATGSTSAGSAAQPAERRDDHHRDEHRRGEPVDPGHRAVPRDTMREDDVEGEERRVREREGDADRLRLELDVGEEVDAADREDERGAVPQRARPESGEPDHRQELDRGHRAERQPVDGDVEADVHHREHRAQREDEPRPGGVEGRERPPRPPPRGEDRRRGRDPEPRDPEGRHEREEKHGEGRPQVVEDGAADEVGLGRDPIEARRPLRLARESMEKVSRRSYDSEMDDRRAGRYTWMEGVTRRWPPKRS